VYVAHVCCHVLLAWGSEVDSVWLEESAGVLESAQTKSPGRSSASVASADAEVAKKENKIIKRKEGK